MFYLAFARVGWALGLSVMVVVFASGHGGKLRHALQSDFWVPLARLTYQAYLIHPIW